MYSPKLPSSMTQRGVVKGIKIPAKAWAELLRVCTLAQNSADRNERAAWFTAIDDCRRKYGKDCLTNGEIEEVIRPLCAAVTPPQKGRVNLSHKQGSQLTHILPAGAIPLPIIRDLHPSLTECPYVCIELGAPNKVIGAFSSHDLAKDFANHRARRQGGTTFQIGVRP